MRHNNSVELIGSVTQPPKHEEGRMLIFTVGGTFKDRSGRDVTFYHEVIVPGKAADIVAKKIKQHAAVRVTGTLSESTWEKDGKKNSKIQVKSFDVDLLHRDQDADFIADSAGGKRLADAENRVALIGNVGAEPQRGSGDVKVTRLRVAVNDGGGEERKTHWVNVTGFDDHAESLTGAQKGDRIYIEGHLVTENWKDKTTGETRYSTYVKTTRIEYLIRPE